MPRGVIPSEGDYRQITETVREFRRQKKGRTGETPWGRRTASGDVLQGFLAGDLDAPADPLGPPTTCVLDVYARDPSTGVLSYSGTQVTFSNYSVDTVAEAGTHAHVHEVNGVWQLCWLDCSAQVSSSGGA